MSEMTPAYRHNLTPFWRFMDWLCESIERITHRRLYTTERASEYEPNPDLYPTAHDLHGYKHGLGRCACEACKVERRKRASEYEEER